MLCHYFADEEQAQRGQLICPRSHSRCVALPGLRPSLQTGIPLLFPVDSNPSRGFCSQLQLSPAVGSGTPRRRGGRQALAQPRAALSRIPGPRVRRRTVCERQQKTQEKPPPHTVTIDVPGAPGSRARLGDVQGASPLAEPRWPQHPGSGSS